MQGEGAAEGDKGEIGASEGGPEKQVAAAAAQAAAARKLGKDPTARTDFLPDREREAQEIAVREQLKKEYELRQKVPLYYCARLQKWLYMCINEMTYPTELPVKRSGTQWQARSARLTVPMQDMHMR